MFEGLPTGHGGDNATDKQEILRNVSPGHPPDLTFQPDLTSDLLGLRIKSSQSGTIIDPRAAESSPTVE